MPDHILSQLLTKIKPEWKVAFLSSFIIGILTHLYILTNMLPNHDGLINIYSDQMNAQSGRFFLGIFNGISSYFTLPFIIGLLSILYLSLTSTLVVEIFNIKKTLAIILVSAVLVTFPSVGATFSYMFTADSYMAGILLTVLSVLVTHKWKYGFIPGSVLLYISLGIYQANLTLFLTLIILWLFISIINQRLPKFDFMKLFLRSMITAIGGLVLYALTFIIYQNRMGGEVADYQGLSDIGEEPDLTEWYFPIENIVNKFLEFFFRGFITDFPVNLFEILNVCLFLLIMLGFMLFIIHKKLYSKPVQLFIALLSVCLLPFIAFILYFISSEVHYHMLMVFSLAFLFITPILIYDALDQLDLVAKYYAWMTIVVSLMIVFNFTVINNISYLNMTLKYERSAHFVTRLVVEMEEVEGVNEAERLAIIGKVKMDSITTEKVKNQIPNMMGAMGNHFLIEPYHYEYFLSDQFGIKLKAVDPHTMENLLQNEDIQHMPSWPSNDSIQMIDDIVVVKLSE